MTRKRPDCDIAIRPSFLYAFHRKRVSVLDSYDNDFLFIDDFFCVYVDFREKEQKDLKKYERMWEQLLLEESE